MTKWFKNTDQLFQHIKKQASDAMNDEVAENVKEVESRHVKKDVYGAYTGQDPYIDRRNGNGGLADTSNMIHTVTSTINGLELFVKNVAKGNQSVYNTSPTNPPNYLAGIIEHGRNKGRFMYNQTNTQEQYLQPRPFISNSMQEIERTLSHVRWLKDGLEKRGLDVRSFK